MKLGIDFGTTRVVVAHSDRGNYPVVSFEAGDASYEWFPPLVALRAGERKYGWDAWAVQNDPGWTVLRSLKRLLEDAGPQTHVQLGDVGGVPLLEMLAGMADALRTAIRETSSVRPDPGEPLEVMLGVPANANSNQRFLTVDAFRRAGFEVLGLLNEPSAASIEYGHRQRGTAKPEKVLVYDLGGGTFDASLVDLDQRTHSVAASEGIPTLGGDDFDQILAEMALERSGTLGESLTASEWFRLQDECRRQKEALNPNTRRIAVDLDAVRPGLGQANVPAAEFYERSRPLLESSLELVARLLEQQGYPGGAGLDTVYITGGASEMPLVARLLRESYGRKVKRSSYTRAATAIGLAIQADEATGYVLRERFTRHFGVWREAAGGQLLVFDPIFPRGTPLPGAKDEPLTIRRAYYPVHNIGHFRYLESSNLSDSGWPTGDLAVWDEIRFPFEAALATADLDLESVAVTHMNGSMPPQHIEEEYACDATGTVRVTIRNRTSGYDREYRLGRWSGKAAALEPVRKGRKRLK